MSANSWLELKAIDGKDASFWDNLLPANDNNILMTMNISEENIIRVHKYDTKRSQWIAHSEYDTKVENSSYQYGQCDRKEYKHHLCLYSNGFNQTHHYLILIDLSISKMVHKTKVNDIIGQTKLCIIGKYWHLIGEEEHKIFELITAPKHDQSSDCVEDMTSLIEHGALESHGLVDGGLIHLPSKDVLLYFGGFREDDNCDVDEIQQYSIMEQEWSTAQYKLPKRIEQACCILSNDQRFIFLLGGKYYDGDEFDYSFKYDIMIFDVETKETKKSNIKLPEVIKNDIQGVAIREDTDVLVYGYLHCFENIPLDIVGFMQQMVYIEYVYIMEQYCKLFFRISVDEILDQCKSM